MSDISEFEAGALAVLKLLDETACRRVESLRPVRPGVMSGPLALPLAQIANALENALGELVGQVQRGAIEMLTERKKRST